MIVAPNGHAIQSFQNFYSGTRNMNLFSSNGHTVDGLSIDECDPHCMICSVVQMLFQGSPVFRRHIGNGMVFDEAPQQLQKRKETLPSLSVW
jgi:hypothetical protein